MKNIVFVLLASSMALFSACKRSAVESTVPSVVSVPDANNLVISPFNAFGTSPGLTTEQGTKNQNRLIFSGGDILGFDFTLSKPVSYRITIDGLTSHAQHVISGITDKSTHSVDSKTWVGETSNGIIFNDLQVKVTFEVLVDYKYVVLGTDIVFTGAGQNIKTNPDGIKYYVLDDFESASNFATPYSDLLELPYFKYNLNINNKKNPYGGIQGNYCMWWYANDTDYNTYGGGTDLKSGASQSPFVLYNSKRTIKTTDPDSLFINAYVCGTGKAGTSLLVIVWEKDDPNHVFTAKSKYSTDRYGVEYPITWTGWQLVSIPYSAFKKTNATYGNGNGILEPQNFGGISIGIDSYPIGGHEVECYLDYFVATEGGPLQP